jgi:hypothetical protein
MHRLRDMMKLRLIAIVAAALLLLAPGDASALLYQANVEGPACGCKPRKWNATKGSLVLHKAASSGGGPVSFIMRAVGEAMTHVSLVRSAFSAMQSTMRAPPICVNLTNTSVRWMCDEITAGFPGAQRLRASAYHIGANSNSNLFYKQGNSSASTLVDWADNTTQYVGVASKDTKCDPNDPKYHYCQIWRMVEVGTNPWSNPTPMPYVMYQFRDLESIHTTGSRRRFGAVCSTYIAYLWKKAGRGEFSAYTYSNAQLRNAMDQTKPAIYNDCRNAGQSHETCERISNQVLNAFVADQGKEWSATPWTNVYDDSSSTARTISPDRLIAAGVHSNAGGAWTGGESGMQSLSWSSTSECGCWY